MIAIAILTAFAAGLHFGRVGEKRTQSRFRPVATSIKAYIRYVDHEPTVSAMREGGAL